MSWGNRKQSRNRYKMQAHEGTASFYVGSALIGFNRNKILFMDATGCRRSRYGGRRIRWVRKMIPKCRAVVRPSKWKSKNCQPNDFLTLLTRCAPSRKTTQISQPTENMNLQFHAPRRVRRPCRVKLEIWKRNFTFAYCKNPKLTYHK